MKVVDRIHQHHKEMNTTTTITTTRMTMEQIELEAIISIMETEPSHCNRNRCFKFICRDITSNENNGNYMNCFIYFFSGTGYNGNGFGPYGPQALGGAPNNNYPLYGNQYGNQYGNPYGSGNQFNSNKISFLYRIIANCYIYLMTRLIKWFS